MTTAADFARYARLSGRPECAGTGRYAVQFQTATHNAQCPVCARLIDRAQLLGPNRDVVPSHSAPVCGVGQLLADVGGL